MAVLVVDTNVWVVASGRSDMPGECVAGVSRFVVQLKNSGDHLAVDTQWKIMKEYSPYIESDNLAHEIIFRVLIPESRLDYRSIELDADGNAIVPPCCAIHHLDDRKFVAVALAHEAHPPIHNASDPDWLEDEAIMAKCGVQVIHHCEAELRRRFQT